MAFKEQTQNTVKEQPLHAGHRERMRQRFQRSGFDGMLDYEVLETLLMMLLPRKDVKPLAKKLLMEFHTVSEVLEQPIERLEKFPGLGKSSAIGLKMINAASSYCLHERCFRNQHLLQTQEALINFVRMKLGLKRFESYMMIFMDPHHHVIEYKVIAEGTVNHVFTYLRNIVEMAMYNGASEVVLVHNHPSGVCTPSPEDLRGTVAISQALKNIGVILIDHLIVTHDEYFSFAAHGLQLIHNSGEDKE